MAVATQTRRPLTHIKALKQMVAHYQRPNSWRAWWQVVNSLGAYAAVWALMALSAEVSWWLTVPLALLASGLLLRIFIIFHDCGHGSFFKSRRANRICGFVCGVLTFTPYGYWCRKHARHHATAGNLDRRGIGDIWTLTVQEYLEASRWKRFSYRLSRNPFVLFVIAPIYLFLIHQRFAGRGSTRRDHISVWSTNVAILAVGVGLSAVFGVVPYLVIQLSVIGLTGSAGIWMFYVQHQFEDVYWEHQQEWDFAAAALQGSSYYKLPKVLQWFTGNIGFHHIHHLSPRIPNYNLARCHNAIPTLQTVPPVTLRTSLRSLSLRLWDESAQELVGWHRLKRYRRRQYG